MKQPRGMLTTPSRRAKTIEPRLHDELQVEIDALSNSGDGVARIGGRVVFVPATAPGDVVRVRIVGAKKRFLSGRLLELLESGPDRVVPPCPHFGTCGGCDWQHIAYTAQLDAKREQLRETLVRIGGFVDPEVEPVIACPDPWHYRNRIQGEAREGRLHMHRRGSGEPVLVERCLIADERINAQLAKGLPSDCGGRVELAMVDGKVRIDPVDQRGTELGFRQVNDAMAGTLESLVLDSVATARGTRVLDLYCGAGAWTCRVAEANPDRKVIGIELHAGNVRAARTRAAGLANVRFQQGRVESLLGALAPGDSVCIVDPPRAGLDPAVIERLRDNPARRFIYVSCHPATLARDLAALGTDRYTLERVRPLDMFPHTAHLETVVILAAR